MKNPKRFIVSNFSENIFLIRIDLKKECLDTSLFFLSLSEFLRNAGIWVEVVSAEESISVKYNCLDLSSSSANKILQEQLEEFSYQEMPENNPLISIPVYYSKEFGLDIDDMTNKLSLSLQEIVDLHSSITYKVKAVGFTPGFAYLGDLPDQLFMPRLDQPRVSLLPGSVGISENRTGIYPFGGPGGWRIIGRTPKKLFDPKKNNPFLITAGKNIKFEAITKNQYEDYEQENL